VTTAPDVLAAEVDPVDRPTRLRQLNEQLPRFVRVVHALKALYATEGRDNAALVLLFPLTRLGPLRQGALAELVHADPSTVSRHVTALVDRGLVRRVADESDGRASRLVVTDAGRAALDGLCRQREALLDAATASWPAEDVTTLTGLIARLVDGLETVLPSSSAPTDPTAPRGTR
jgi:DNA-binding MarR family transcriptional regulator